MANPTKQSVYPDRRTQPARQASLLGEAWLLHSQRAAMNHNRLEGVNMVTQYIQRFTKQLSSLSPRAAIAGALVVIVGVAGLALLLTRGSSEANANPALQPRAARLDKVD